MGALSRRRAVPRPLPLVLCSILWSGEAFVSSRRRYLQRRTSSNPNNDVRLQFTVSSTATSRPAPWQSVKDPFPGGNSPRIVLYSASSMADSRRRGRRRLKSEQLLPLASSKTTYDSNNKSPGLMASLFQFSVVVAAYLLHLLVLSQRQVVFPVQLFPNDRGHFTGLGWDSIAGMVSLCVYGIQQSISKLRNKQLYQQQRSVRPWNLPRDNLRFRLTTSLTCVLLVQAYFLTGRMSIFWEDMLYELSARDFAITIPLFRALTVLLGHLSWVIVGSSLLRWLPRPPPFFQKREHVSVSVNNSRAPSEPTTGNNAANDKGNVIEEVIEEYIDDGDDDLDDSPPDSKIYKKLFRTDISTLYSQTGIPKKHPSQVPDIPPKQTKGHKPRKKQIRRVKSVSPSNSLIPQSPQQQQSEPQTPLTSMYYWFSNNSSSNWMWWTIGGYFVSSWLFNVADLANQYLLPIQLLQDSQESIVSQLVQPEHNDILASIVGYIAPCLSAPWWEEILYRGFCLPAMTQLMGFRWAVFLQGILFSAHHMSLTGALPLAVLGWTWAAVYAKSRNIKTVIIIHMLWNSRVFIGSWMGL